ncbi:MAG: KGK domain-containing protein [Nostocaceae cyanobacterium]|nr:KGK domain-containing protein [Nostocaceae cyanobacterium]
MKNEVVSLTRDDVVSLLHENKELFNSRIFTIGEEIDKLADRFFSRKDGVECRILRASGGGWKKGKVRLSLEFIPDEPEQVPQQPESILDDLRRLTN